MPNTPTPGQETLHESNADHCQVCGCMLEPESCWQCLGAGGFHNCGEDTCCCLDPEALDDVCEECEGEGGYLVCPNAMRHPAHG
jgi:hypothetical protein